MTTPELPEFAYNVQTRAARIVEDDPTGPVNPANPFVTLDR